MEDVIIMHFTCAQEPHSLVLSHAQIEGDKLHGLFTFKFVSKEYCMRA